MNLLMGLAAIGCMSGSPAVLAAQGAGVVRPAVKGLSRQAAEGRTRRIGGVDYRLSFKLDDSTPEFSGLAEIRFQLRDAGSPLTVDFTEGRIQEVRANGRRVEPDYNGLFLALPAEALQLGENRIEIGFLHPYSNAGMGLYRFKDPQDGRVYLYTDFEPYDANRLFPCFDQPDLKASFTLEVEAPPDWTVISSVPESEVVPAENDRRLWKFPASARFSTYLFSLHAGPYREWKSSQGKIPIRLFAPQSLASYVEVEEWFTITRQGLEFFGRYFGRPYPFGKYDQVIVPDFNAGAMENVAAVTFSDRFVHRGRPTLEEREDRANVILHEMAHMWFGNLVTMRWWDDLWLNESFASYMAAMALHEATEFKRSWESFLGEKHWAYREDQLITTHPIEADVPDTQQAFANFDGITYGKGAAVLKQVSYHLGPESFRKGVRLYFQRHAFGNAMRKDFISALEASSGRKLDRWTREWLQTAGLNTVEARYACRGGKVSSFELHQKAPGNHPFLREHRTQVGLYREGSDGKTRPSFVLPHVAYGGRVTPVAGLAGKPCPLMVYPNHGDHDYVKVRLDDRSVRAIQEKLSEVEDDLLRGMLWQSLWEKVRDGELGVVPYLDIVLNHAAKETSLKTLTQVFETVYGYRLNSPSVLYYLPWDDPRASSLLEAQSRRLESFFWAGLEKASPGTDFRKLWWDGFVRVARTTDAVRRLQEAVSGKAALPGFELDPDRRWKTVAQLSRLGADGAEGLRKREFKRDPSRRGQTSAIQAEVLSPAPKVKEKWLQSVFSEESGYALADLREAMGHLFPFEQYGPRKQFAGEFYAKLPGLAERRTDEFLSAFTRHLAPAYCDLQDSEDLKNFVQGHPSLRPVVLKNLRMAQDETERCARIRSRAAPLY